MEMNCAALILTTLVGLQRSCLIPLGGQKFVIIYSHLPQRKLTNFLSYLSVSSILQFP